MSSGYEGRRNESYRAAWELAWERLPIDALPEVAKATGSEFDGRTFCARLLDRSGPTLCTARQLPVTAVKHW